MFDAAARSIANGCVVRVFNDRGQTLAGAVVCDAIRQGVLRVAEGGWCDPVEGGKLTTPATAALQTFEIRNNPDNGQHWVRVALVGWVQGARAVARNRADLGARRGAVCHTLHRLPCAPHSRKRQREPMDRVSQDHGATHRPGAGRAIPDPRLSAASLARCCCARLRIGGRSRWLT